MPITKKFKTPESILDAKLHFGYDPSLEFNDRSNLFSSIQYRVEKEGTQASLYSDYLNEGLISDFIKTLIDSPINKTEISDIDFGKNFLPEISAGSVFLPQISGDADLTYRAENFRASGLASFEFQSSFASTATGASGKSQNSPDLKHSALSLVAGAASGDGDVGNGEVLNSSVNSEIPDDVAPVASAPIVSVQTAQGYENNTIPLFIAVTSTDSDGTEILTVKITGIPAGGSLSAGINNHDGSWSLTIAQLAGLLLIPPHDFSGDLNLQIIATSSEETSHSSASADLAVHISGVASIPVLQVQNSSGFEDTGVQLIINSHASDASGESLTIVISGVPSGANLSAGVDNHDGSWILQQSDLASLTLLPPANYSGPINLTVTSISYENGTTAQIQAPLQVIVSGVADLPNITANVNPGQENMPLALDITTSVGDNDGSESLIITISGVPSGASLSAGMYNGNGTWTLLPSQLSNLYLIPPNSFSGNFNLLISATSLENGTYATFSLPPLQVNIEGVASLPDLSVHDAIGIEGNPVALDITAALTDTDGSETLTIVLHNIPAGATLSAGFDDGQGNWTLSSQDLVGLTLSLPHNYHGNLQIGVEAISSEGITTAVNSSIISIIVTPVAHAPAITVLPASGIEDANISLNISVTPSDPAETVNVTISNLPPGAVLSAGNDNQDGTWTLTQVDLLNLQLIPAPDWNGNLNLSISATSSINGTIASSSTLLPLAISGTADAPSLSVSNSSGSEDSQIPLNITIDAGDHAAAGVVSVTLGGVPSGSAFSAGIDNHDRTWTFTSSQLTSLLYTSPLNYSGNLHFTVTATASENGTSASTSTSLNVSVAGVVDAPFIDANPASGLEDHAIQLPVSANLTDTDGSEFLSIVIGNMPSGATLSAGIDNHDGTWTLTPAQLTGLTITPPANFSGQIDLSVTAISSENGNSAQSSMTVSVLTSGVADTPLLSVQNASGNEGSAIQLNIAAALIDTDGSEILSIIIGNLPDGATLSAGIDNNDGTWTLDASQLANLTITPPPYESGTFNLHVMAISSENGTTAQTSLNLPVTVKAMADMPNLSVQANISGTEDTPIPLSISADLTDTDGSESLSILVSGMPVGAHLSAGTYNHNGTWTLTAAEITGLTLTPPANYSGNFTLSISAIATEGGTSAHTDTTINIHISGVADIPNLITHASGGASGTDVPLNIQVSSPDTDGSETFHVMIGNVPAGAVLSAGIDNHDGTWTLTSAQLVNLTITPPPFSSGIINLSVMGISSENGTSAQTSLITLPVSIGGVADLPTLNVQASSGSEDQEIPLIIAAGLTDSDGSEILIVEIGGLPVGAYLSAGVDNHNGTWELTPDQLTGLTITPPPNFSGQFNLTVKSISLEGGTTSEILLPLSVHVSGIADAPSLSVFAASGMEDGTIPLNIGASLTDIDSSENLSIVIGNIPSGAALSAGVNNYDGTWTLTVGQLTNLTITPPAFASGILNLTVTAIASEDGTTAQTSLSLPITVTGVADLPNLSVQASVSGPEDGLILLPITASLTDTDGSETLTVTISGLPVGASLSAGTNNGNGNWTLSAGQLTGLNLIPPADYSGDFTLSVSAISTEGSSSAHIDASINVHVSGVADAPILSVQSTAGSEGLPIPLVISAISSDADSSENISVIIGNVPLGATLSAGTNNHDGTWTLASGQLSNLTITPPAFASGLLNLSVMAISSEDGTVSQTSLLNLPVTISGIADAPLLTVSGGVGLEDHAIPLVINADLLDTDGSETLSIRIENVPAGANLSAGLDNGNGIWTLTSAELTGLNITPPHNFSGQINLQVKAISTEGGTASEVSVPLTVQVSGVADIPNISVQAAIGDEGTAIHLSLAASLNDTDGSENLIVIIGNVPLGATLSAGTNNHDGTWMLTSGQLANLTITPPAFVSGVLNLSVKAIVSENGTSAETLPVSLPVTVNGIADTPNLHVTNAVGIEDNVIPLTITAGLADTDGSESIKIIISDVPVGTSLSAGANQGNGSWELTSTDLVNLNFTAASDFSGQINLTVSAIASESGTSTRVDLPLTVLVSGVADLPSLSVQAATGAEGSAIALNISASLTDTDGSENLSIIIGNMPVGAVLSAGVNNHDGTWTLTGNQLAGLEITPPAFTSGVLNLSVMAQSSENGTTAQTSIAVLPVNISGVADLPSLQVMAAIGIEDQTIPLSINAGLADADDSETLSVTIRGIPSGAALSAGTNNGNGVWVLTPAQLTGLTLTPPANFSGSFNLEISAISTEGATTAHVDVILPVTVSGLADVPNLLVHAVSGNEDMPILLNISASLADLDGSESLTVMIGGVPLGASLSAGTNLGGGIWSLTQAQISNLSLTPATHWSGDIGLTITAISSENGTDASAITTINVHVAGAATTPLLSVFPVVGVEDVPVALGINAALVDADGSETLSIVLSGVPAGASLSTGMNNGNGTWTLTSAQLTGLTFTPPLHASGNFVLTVEAISSENGTTALSSAALPIMVGGTATTPALSVSAATTLEDNAVPLAINATLLDMDGSETLSVTISGLPAGSALSAGSNAGGVWTLTPSQLTGLTLIPPANWSGSFNLSVSATSHEGATTASASLNLPVTVSGVADAPWLNVHAVSGNEDMPISLGITAGLADADGSETLSVIVSDVPSGASLSAGTDNGNGTWTLSLPQLTGLSVTPPANFSGLFTLGITAISSEGITNASTFGSIPVSVNGIATPPLLNVSAASGLEDIPIALSIDASLLDTDGSESLSITIGNVPLGGVLSAGVNNDDGTWTLTLLQLTGLTYLPPLNSSGLTTLSVTATSSENGTSAATIASLPINITGVADAPNLSIHPVSGQEDTPLMLGISASLIDTNSETLSITISGVPAGAVMSAGINNGNGTWTITPAQLSNLSLVPPSNYSGFFTLNVTANSVEGASSASTVGIIPVTITGIADKPTLNVSPATGLENSSISLNISSVLADTDGSEILSVTISGVPTGASLSAGLNTGNGVWVLTPAQLSNLTMTPPLNYNGAFALSVIALSTEGATNNSITASLPVTIAGVASSPALVVSAAVGNEDTSIPLSISASLTDSSEILSLVISGVPSGASLSHGLYAGNGKWSLSGSDLSGLTISPPANYSGTMGLTITAISTETNGAHAELSVPLNVTVTAVADAPILKVSAIGGSEDTSISLNISAILFDNDGSEVLTATISGVPLTATLSAGTSLGAGIWSLTAAQLANLKITPPANSDADFTLTVSITSREMSTNTTSTVSASLPVIVDAVADIPTVSASNTVAVGNQANLSINGSLTDTDGSETITYLVQGIPDGFALNKGINNGDNTWTLKAGDLTGLKIIAPEQFNGQLNLKVTSVSHEVTGGFAVSTPYLFNARFGNYASGYLVDLALGVNIGGIGVGVQVGALPPIDLLPASGGILGTSGIYAKEDTSYLIADAPNILGIPLLSAVIGLLSKIQYSGIPAGVTFSSGTNKGGGVWEFTSAQLTNLYMNVPANSDNDFTILVTAKLIGLADLNLISTPVHVMGVADMPNLTASLGAGTEDTAIALNIAGSLTDTDGSETLTFLVSGMPAGFTLNKGIQNGNGTWSVSISDLTGLMVIPAANYSGMANLVISAISTEREGDQTVRQQNISINIAAVTDAPLLATLPIQNTTEDQSMTLNLGISLRDTDGSEQIGSVTLSGLPSGASLIGATDNHNGTWSVDVAHLDQVKFVPPSNWSGDFNLNITATSVESSTGLTGLTSSSSGTISIHVGAVADAPIITAIDATGFMDQAISLHLDAVLTDNDGSESLTAVISGVPDHALLSAGLNNGDGTWTLTKDQLSSVTITPPEHFIGDIELSMTAYSRDGHLSWISSHEDFTVHVEAAVSVMSNMGGWVDAESQNVSAFSDNMSFFTDVNTPENSGNGHDIFIHDHSNG